MGSSLARLFVVVMLLVMLNVGPLAPLIDLLRVSADGGSVMVNISSAPSNLIILNVSENTVGAITENISHYLLYLSDTEAGLERVIGTDPYDDGFDWAFGVPFSDGVVGVVKFIASNGSCSIYYILVDIANNSVMGAWKYHAGKMLCPDQKRDPIVVGGPGHSILVAAMGPGALGDEDLFYVNDNVSNPAVEDNRNSILTLMNISASGIEARVYYVGREITYNPSDLNYLSVTLDSDDTMLLSIPVSPYFAMTKEYYYTTTYYNLTSNNLTRSYTTPLLYGVVQLRVDKKNLTVESERFYHLETREKIVGTALPLEGNKSLLIYTLYESGRKPYIAVLDGGSGESMQLMINETAIDNVLREALNISDRYNLTATRLYYDIEAAKSAMFTMNGSPYYAFSLTARIYYSSGYRSEEYRLPVLLIINATSGSLEKSIVLPYTMSETGETSRRLELYSVGDSLVVTYQVDSNGYRHVFLVYPSNGTVIGYDPTLYRNNMHALVSATYTVLGSSIVYGVLDWDRPTPISLSQPHVELVRASRNLYDTLNNFTVKCGGSLVETIPENLTVHSTASYIVMSITPEAVEPDPFMLLNITSGLRLSNESYIGWYPVQDNISARLTRVFPGFIMPGTNMSIMSFRYWPRYGSPQVEIDPAVLAGSGYTIVVNGYRPDRRVFNISGFYAYVSGYISPYYDIRYNMMNMSGNRVSIILMLSPLHDPRETPEMADPEFIGSSSIYVSLANKIIVNSTLVGGPNQYFDRYDYTGGDYIIWFRPVNQTQPPQPSDKLPPYPLAAVKIMPSMSVQTPGRSNPLRAIITNIGNTRGVFVVAFFMPFYFDTDSAVVERGNAEVYSVRSHYSVRDSCLVWIVRTVLDPYEYTTIVFHSTINRSLATLNLEEPEKTWYGFSYNPLFQSFNLSVGQAGFLEMYMPMSVQLANVPEEWWNNNITATTLDGMLEQAINLSVEFNDWYFERLLDMNATNLTRIVQDMYLNGTIGDRLLAEYIHQKFWSYSTRMILGDLMNRDYPGEFVTGPVDTLFMDVRDKIERFYDQKRTGLYNNTYQGVPGIIVELISLAQDYNTLQLINYLTSPIDDYYEATLEINETLNLADAIRTIWCNTAGKILLSPAPQPGQRKLIVPALNMRNCVDRLSGSGAVPPEVYELYLERELSRLKDPLGSAARSFVELLSDLDAAGARLKDLRNTLYERYGTSDPQELAQLALQYNDPDIVDYLMLLMSRNRYTVMANAVAGLISSFDPTTLGVLVHNLVSGDDVEGTAALSPLYAMLIDWLDNAGVTSELAGMGVYLYGSRIPDPLGQSGEAFAAGYMEGAVLSLYMAAPSLAKLGVDAGNYFRYMAKARGIGVSLSDVEKLNIVNIKNPKLVKISGTLLDKYLEPAAYKIAVGDTQAGTRLMEEALEYMRSQGLLTESGLGAEMLVHDTNTIMFASKPVGPYPKPLLIEVVDSDNTLGAVATISREPGTGYNYISFNHVKEKVFTINAGGSVKKIHPADIHVFTMEKTPYIYSMKKQSIIVSSELIEAYNTNPYSLATLFDDSGMRAIASYIVQNDATVEEAYKFLGLYRELKFKIRAHVADKEVAQEIVNLLESYMRNGDYQSILQLGRDYGLVDDAGRITGVNLEVMSAKDFVDNIRNMDAVRAIREASTQIDSALQRYYLNKAGKAAETLLFDMRLAAREDAAYYAMLAGTAPPDPHMIAELIRDANMDGRAPLRSLGTKTRPPLPRDCHRNGDLPGEAIILAYNVPYIPKATPIPVRIIASMDPNELYVYPTRYILSNNTIIQVMVYFENSPQATAPAQTIAINLSITGPANLTQANITAYTPTHADISTSITGNTIRITLENANLPPNKNPPQGEGAVTLQIPIENARPGDTIKAQATITFDNNPPINTSKRTLLVDLEPPSITITSHKERDNAITINYTCADDASGCSQLLLAQQDSQGNTIQVTAINVTSNTLTIRKQNSTAQLIIRAIDDAGRISTPVRLVLAGPEQPGPEPTTPKETSSRTGQEEKGTHWWLLAIPLLIAVAGGVMYARMKKKPAPRALQADKPPATR